MTRLLVSVRDALEAEAAVAGGADIIDVKEPRRGSLGVADAQHWREVAAVLATTAPDILTSVALGELRDHLVAREASVVPSQFQLAKVGLAGMVQTDWGTALSRVLREKAPSAEPVAVVYADWESAVAPAPHDVLAWSQRNSCAWVLVDTFAKDSGNILDLWGEQRLRDWIVQVHNGGLKAAIAGSISREILAVVLSTRPDVIAVRGAACEGDRTSQVSERCVRLLRDALSVGSSFE